MSRKATSPPIYISTVSLPAMSIIISLIVGAIIGAIAAALTHTHEGWLANIIVGIVGSLLGAWFFGSVLGIGGAYSAGTFTLSGLVWGIVGAVGLLLVLRALNLFGYRDNR
jgi:uncharacterized membrane protein YeaQ/YmgE (transglycosylase-associated protein family)